ncbi:MAG: hypothetical protein ACI4QT_04975 [Kiritimatiellia bacterium]
MTKIFLVLMLALCLCPGLSAKEIAVGTQGVSPFPDSEVSTNIAFNASRNDVKTFDVRIELASSVSNCVQVAFGRDADGDGELAPEETGLVLGWRSGRYFVEDVAGENRYFETESVADSGLRFLHLNAAMDSAFVPRRASFKNGLGACFAEIADACPPWLFSAEWNLLKITRRGADSAGELCRIRNDYRFFRVVFR